MASLILSPTESLLRLNGVPFLRAMRAPALAVIAATGTTTRRTQWQRPSLWIPLDDDASSDVPCYGLTGLLRGRNDGATDIPRLRCKGLRVPIDAVISLWRDRPVDAERVLRALCAERCDQGAPITSPAQATPGADGLLTRLRHLARQADCEAVNRATLFQWVRNTRYHAVSAGEALSLDEDIVASVLHGSLRVGDTAWSAGVEAGLAHRLAHRELPSRIVATQDSAVLTYDVAELLQLAHADPGMMRALIAWSAGWDGLHGITGE